MFFKCPVLSLSLLVLNTECKLISFYINICCFSTREHNSILFIQMARATVRNSTWRMVGILDLFSTSFPVSSQLLFAKSVFPQNMKKIGGVDWKLDPIFEIQDGARSPSWNFSLHLLWPHDKSCCWQNQSCLKIW